MQSNPTQKDNSCFHFSPFKIQDSSTLTPDNPQFFKFDLNIAILTKYGRYVYIRHGNQEKCSSFFATLCTIVNKLELSFGSQQQPARLKKIRQGKLTFYVLRRKNYMYICWTKVHFNELSIYSSIEFLHYQLTSSLTQKVNNILNENQTYDPTINFGKGRAIHNLLSYSILNGLYSLPILFNSLPILTLKTTIRSTIYNILKEPKDEEEGILVSILMSMSHLISIWKRKGVQFSNRDFLLLFNLLQTNSTLCKSQNWFPICFPGMDGETMLFCYLKYINQDLVHVMVSDQSEKFPQLSQVCKQLAHSIQQTPGILPSIKTSLQSWIKNDPFLQRAQMFHHFLVVNLELNQMIQSSYNYFGYNQDSEYLKYIFTYTQLYQHYLRSYQNQSQKLHVQTFKQYICGYYQDGQMLLMFICPMIMDLQECKNVIASILKFVKQEQKNLFITFMK